MKVQCYLAVILSVHATQVYEQPGEHSITGDSANVDDNSAGSSVDQIENEEDCEETETILFTTTATPVPVVTTTAANCAHKTTTTTTTEGVATCICHTPEVTLIESYPEPTNPEESFPVDETQVEEVSPEETFEEEEEFPEESFDEEEEFPEESFDEEAEFPEESFDEEAEFPEESFDEEEVVFDSEPEETSILVSGAETVIGTGIFGLLLAYPLL
jgi:hypothetical protein